MRRLISALLFMTFCTPAFASVTVQGLTLKGVTTESTRIIVVFGDSISWGTGSPRWSYRKDLQDLLGVGVYDFAGPYSDPSTPDAVYDEDHAAVGGDDSTDALARITDVTDEFTANKDWGNSWVIVMIGTNDCQAYNCTAVTTALDNIDSIIAAIRAVSADINILIVQPTPGNNGATINGRLVAFAPYLEAHMMTLIASDAKLHHFDAFSMFNDTDYCNPDYLSCLGDVIHPNSTGYNALAVGIKNCMTNFGSEFCDGN